MHSTSLRARVNEWNRWLLPICHISEDWCFIWSCVFLCSHHRIDAQTLGTRTFSCCVFNFKSPNINGCFFLFKSSHKAGYAGEFPQAYGWVLCFRIRSTHTAFLQEIPFNKPCSFLLVKRLQCDSLKLLCDDLVPAGVRLSSFSSQWDLLISCLTLQLPDRRCFNKSKGF